MKTDPTPVQDSIEFPSRGLRLVHLAQEFLKLEAFGGILLVIAAIIAIGIANSPLSPFYNAFLNKFEFIVGFTDHADLSAMLKKPILLWINDGLMAVFFFLVGLEIKREILRGELSSRARALLPFLAAIGGTIVPAAIFYFINQSYPENLPGWAIPSATDIAFALGVLALLGSRIPQSLKILLMAIAVIDDLMAILIIALFYTATIHITALYIAVIAFMLLVILNQSGVSRTAPYIILGFILWVAMLKSGVHATIAGVMTAFCVPMGCKQYKARRPLESLEHSLHPWVAYGILPIFAFANAGISFHGIGIEHLLAPVASGIIGGLVIGKTVGVLSTIYITVKTGLCEKPEGASWVQILGVACLCGIGFTMSLFIGELSYADQIRQAEIRLGVLTGSVISAIIGYTILRLGSVGCGGSRGR